MKGKSDRKLLARALKLTQSALVPYFRVVRESGGICVKYTIGHSEEAWWPTTRSFLFGGRGRMSIFDFVDVICFDGMENFRIPAWFKSARSLEELVFKLEIYAGGER